MKFEWFSLVVVFLSLLNGRQKDSSERRLEEKRIFFQLEISAAAIGQIPSRNGHRRGGNKIKTVFPSLIARIIVVRYTEEGKRKAR